METPAQYINEHMPRSASNPDELTIHRLYVALVLADLHGLHAEGTWCVVARDTRGDLWKTHMPFAAAVETYLDHIQEIAASGRWVYALVLPSHLAGDPGDIAPDSFKE